MYMYKCPYVCICMYMYESVPCNFCAPGSKFITGSYDRTCRVWDTLSGGRVRYSDTVNHNW